MTKLTLNTKAADAFPDTHTVGRLGEKRVGRYYRLRGYRIREFNFRASHDEIDLVAENHRTLVFVEVKTRLLCKGERLLKPPAAAVDAEKKRHLLQAARAYLVTHDLKKTVRFDIAEVYGRRAPNGKIKISRISVIKNAF